MAPEPISTEAEAAAAGLATPQNLDLLAQGDDAILRNARFTTDALKAAAAAQDAAAGAAGEVLADLDPGSIVRGKASTLSGPAGSAWRHTTEDGHLLPLGYGEDGHLDDFARRIFREDLMGAEVAPALPDYAHLWITDDGTNRLLLGIRWDGTVDIPGLAGSSGASGSAVYTDAPYHAGSDVLPVHTDASHWALWGSSSAERIGPYLKTLATDNGAALTEGGKGSERAEQIAARLGSRPFLLSPTDGSLTVPASGSVAVTPTVSSPAHQYLRTYSGNWAGVHGSLRWDAGLASLVFDRTTAGDPVTLLGPAALIPEAGQAARDAVTLLWMGKNNTSTTASAGYVVELTDEAHDWLAPLQKRCLVLGHFINSNVAGDSAQAVNVRAINAAHAARYGDTYLDVQGYLMSAQVWTDTGITPTQEDLDHQAAGNLPPSLALDPAHLNAAAYTAVRDHLIVPRMAALSWL